MAMSSEYKIPKVQTLPNSSSIKTIPGVCDNAIWNFSMDNDIQPLKDITDHFNWQRVNKLFFKNKVNVRLKMLTSFQYKECKQDGKDGNFVIPIAQVVQTIKDIHQLSKSLK